MKAGWVGNSVTGSFSRTVNETDSTSLVEVGVPASAGGARSFSLTQTTSSSPIITESGNSVTGAYTLVEYGTQAYDTRQTFQPDSIGNSYSLHETGSNATTLNQTGSRSRGTTASRALAATITC